MASTSSVPETVSTLVPSREFLIDNDQHAAFTDFVTKSTPSLEGSENFPSSSPVYSSVSSDSHSSGVIRAFLKPVLPSNATFLVMADPVVSESLPGSVEQQSIAGSSETPQIVRGLTPQTRALYEEIDGLSMENMSVSETASSEMATSEIDTAAGPVSVPQGAIRTVFTSGVVCHRPYSGSSDSSDDEVSIVIQTRPSMPIILSNILLRAAHEPGLHVSDIHCDDDDGEGSVVSSASSLDDVSVFQPLPITPGHNISVRQRPDNSDSDGSLSHRDKVYIGAASVYAPSLYTIRRQYKDLFGQCEFFI